MSYFFKQTVLLDILKLHNSILYLNHILQYNIIIIYKCLSIHSFIHPSCFLCTSKLNYGLVIKIISSQRVTNPRKDTSEYVPPFCMSCKIGQKVKDR
jgi:hypothetical protein